MHNSNAKPIKIKNYNKIYKNQLLNSINKLKYLTLSLDQNERSGKNEINILDTTSDKDNNENKNV